MLYLEIFESDKSLDGTTEAMKESKASASALYPFQIHFFEIITFAQVDIVQLGHFYFV